MKVKVKECKKNEFPKLMINSVNQVVLFRNEKEGVLLVDLDEADIAKCHYSKNWGGLDKFKPFNGTVTLSND